MRCNEKFNLRATQAQLLEARIAENVAAQEVDLVKWIFERMAVTPGAEILELCCGTGAQTIRLLDLVGPTGCVVGVDISREALESLTSKADAAQSSRLTLLEANLDELTQALEKSHLQPPYFDLVFCAYGLYYATDSEKILEEAKRWLKSNGRIVIVGPFDRNNGPLFDLLAKSDVGIPAYVKFTSQEFLHEKVLRWAARNFQSVRINTVVNRIRWNSPEKVLNYWKNSTFYDVEKQSAVEIQLNGHFRNHPEFINEKWIMMVEMANART